MAKSKFIISVLLCLCAIKAAAISTVHINYLHKGWQFRQGSSELWHPAVVPGCVHLDLMRNKIIDNPFYRMNDRSVQWIDKEDWMYTTHFVPTDVELNAEHKTLVFNGLDTYADVYLNHHKLAETDNMHRQYRLPVNGILQKGDNLLEVYFHSPIKRNLPKFDALPYRHNTGPDHSQLGGIFDKTLSPFARTAGFEYGWDWGSRFVTSGIWRPVYLETWSGARIADSWFIQKKVSAQKADLITRVTIEATQPHNNIRVDLLANGKKVASRMVNLQKGTNEISIPYTIAHPHLWWTNGLGEPYLYRFETRLIDAKRVVDERADSIGIRSLILRNDKDKYGHSLYFELNGKPLFAKGSDMVPNDNFLTRCTDSVYRRVVKDAHDVNMNMIRVWGGGVYEDDAFYKYCDRMGILVWQDFMFACQTYEVDSAFLATVRQEAIYNVKRLRNHACMAVYTGNNEEQDVWFGWGGKQKYFASLGQEQRVWKMQHSIFYELLPQVVRQYGGGIAYRPSSPWAFENTPSDGVNGDDHYWGVWHGGQPFEAYYDHHVRFESEYGFQSFPEYESVLKYAPDSIDHNIYSSVMMEHQNAGTYANHRIEEYMNRYYHVPVSFKNFLYVGQVLQADGVKMGMESFRRDKPYCWGSLVWQLNDCWPVASWSSRDYYGRWKALHYFTRKAYDDILVAPRIIKDAHKSVANELVANLPTAEAVRLKAEQADSGRKVVELKLVSDRLTSAKGKLTIQSMSLNGEVLKEQSRKLELPANSSITVDSLDVNQWLCGKAAGDVILYICFTTNGKTYDNIVYPVRQKEMNYSKPDITRVITPAADGYDVKLTTNCFARAVFLSIKGIDNFFSDNYFDMLPGSTRIIHVQTTKSLNDFKHELEITTLADTY